MSIPSNDNSAQPPVAAFSEIGATLADRLAQEEPEVDLPRRDIPYNRVPGGVGQLVAEPDADGPEDLPGEEQSILARSQGAARRDASPEESAMHFTDSYPETDLYFGPGAGDSAIDSGSERFLTETATGDDDEDEDDDELACRDDSAADFIFDEDEADELA